MKKMCFFILLLLNVGLFAQCTLSVTITGAPTAPVCKYTMIVLTANPSGPALAPIYYWIVGNDTTIGATFTVLANSQTIELLMGTSSGCSPDSAYAPPLYIQTVNLEPTPVVQPAECNQTVADVEILLLGDNPPFYFNLIGVGSGTSGSYQNVPQGNYTLYTTDNNGCEDTRIVSIVPFTCPKPIPTEIITPNGDGFNDMWKIVDISYYPENEVFIYDRWGQRVYHKKGYDNLDGWQAKYVGGNLAVSTYYYVLKITIENGDDLVYKGAISVFR
jgi:gliding motility-associated-like protein